VRNRKQNQKMCKTFSLTRENERKLNFFAIYVQFLVATTFDRRNKSFQKLFPASVSPSHVLDAFSYGPEASRIDELVDEDGGEELLSVSHQI
jgi:hypothetical protein